MTHHNEYSNIYFNRQKAQEIENYIYKEKESNNFGPQVPREFNGKYICTAHKYFSNMRSRIAIFEKISYLPLFLKLRLKIAFYNCAKITKTILTHI